MHKFHFQQCISNSWNEHCPNSILGQHLSPCREISALVRISLFFHKSKRDVSRRFSRSWGTLDESPFLNISWGLIVNNVTYFYNNMVSRVYPPPPPPLLWKDLLWWNLFCLPKSATLGNFSDHHGELIRPMLTNRNFASSWNKKMRE